MAQPFFDQQHASPQRCTRADWSRRMLILRGNRAIVSMASAPMCRVIRASLGINRAIPAAWMAQFAKESRLRRFVHRADARDRHGCVHRADARANHGFVHSAGARENHNCAKKWRGWRGLFSLY